MIERIINELKFAEKKNRNCVLGYVDCHILISVLKEKDKEIERLHSIIKEVREYIENKYIFSNGEEEKYILKDTWYGTELLKILDKEN